MSRVLVTGAGGFIGRYVLQALAGGPDDVHASSSSGSEKCGECRWHRADLLDPRQREALVAEVRPDSLLHLAWYAKPPAYWSAPENVDWLSASLDLFRLAARHGCTRVVGAGSCTEYDWHDGYCTEGVTPLRAATLYGTAKAACGSVLEAWSRESGLSAAWGRLFFIFGPHDSPVRLVPSLVQALASGRPARCNTGSHVRDFLHVADAASALVALMRSPAAGAVNIGTGVPLRVGDIAQRIATTIGRPDLLTIADGPPEAALVCANVRRLQTEVGWRPPFSTETRLDETIAWWRTQPVAGAPSSTSGLRGVENACG